MSNVSVVEHPLLQHRLAVLRDRTTPLATFRRLLREAGLLLGCEAIRDLVLEPVEIQTPVALARGGLLRGGPLVLAPILRAGLALAGGLHLAEVRMWAAAVDERLDEHGCFVPGLAMPATAHSARTES